MDFEFIKNTKREFETPQLSNPENFVPGKGILTRYGKKILADGGKHYSSAFRPYVSDNELLWDADVASSVRVSYEYNIETETPKAKPVTDHDLIQERVLNAQFRATMDWNDALGDTRAEKYESLYVNMVELTNLLIHPINEHQVKTYVIIGSQLAEFMQNQGFLNGPQKSLTSIKGGYSRMLGRLHNRWTLFVDPLMEANQVLIGRRQSNGSESNAVLTIANLDI